MPAATLQWMLPPASRRAVRSVGLLLAGLLWAGLPAVVGGARAAAAQPAPAAAEHGFPLIQAIEPGLPEAESQHFDVARDPRGVLYFANLAGVLVYDGAWWRRVEVGRPRSAFSVACDRHGRVAVGGMDELGYLAADAGGTLRYVSLVPRLPAGQRKMGQVSRILELPAGGFLYFTQRWLFRWDGARIAVVATFPGDWPYAAGFAARGEAWIWWRDAGLLRLAGDRLVPLPGGEVFRGRRIDGLLPAAHGYMVSIRGEGLFRWSGPAARPSPPVPFAPAASRWAVDNRVMPGATARLADGRWAHGSVLGGLLLLRPDGAVERVIDGPAGLPDDFVNALEVDRDGALWAALNNGVARLDVGSPLSVLDARSGLTGSVYSVARHRGRLWAGTAAGVFVAEAADGAAGDLRFRALPGLPPAGWSLLPAGGEMLAGTAFGVFEVRGEPGREVVRPVPGTEQKTVYALAGSARDPDRVWAGSEDGVSALRRTPAGWREEGRIAGAPREVTTLAEGRDGVLWCGSTLEGLTGLELPAGAAPAETAEIRPARVHRLAAEGEVHLYRAGGGILAVRESRLLRLDEERRTLVAEPVLARLAGPGRFTAVAEDAAGNLWRNTRPVTVARRARGGGWESPRALTGLPTRTADVLYAEPDGMVWLATEKGLFRYAGGVPGTLQAGAGGEGRGAAAGASTLPAPLFGRVTAGRAELFGGSPTVRPAARELPAGTRRLRVELAPLVHRAGLLYQSRLDPLDTAWGDAVAEPFAELTSLPPGRYTLRARTVGPNGEVSPEAAWRLRVLPHWYQTPWAAALAALLLLALVLGYVRLRSRALRQRAARLEARVAEQTVDLQRSVEELRRAQAGLEAANARLEELSRRDDLTGIANRRRLQQQLAADWERAREARRPIAFVLVDIDHFKRLNDTRGHAEGDLCLQAVARYLDEAVRQTVRGAETGGLVARYGGEEFGVLLPGADLAAAEAMAERLRRGIEALALPHEAAPTGRITASFGVASWVPQLGEKPEALIEDADLALYRAKDGGRNRVCAAAA